MLLESRLGEILVFSDIVRQIHNVDSVLVILIEFVDVVSELLLVPEL